MGSDNSKVKSLLKLAFLHPEKTPVVVRLLQTELVRQGYDIANLPLFSAQSAVTLVDGIHLGSQLIARREVGPLTVSTKDLFSPHLLVVAHSGSGKSMLIKHAVPQLIDHGFNVSLFDAENEHQDIAVQVGLDKVLVLGRNDRENPFAVPEGMPYDEWLAQVDDCFRECYYLRDLSMNLFHALVSKEYDTLLSAGSDKYPTLRKIESVLQRQKFPLVTRSAQARDSLLNRFMGIKRSFGSTIQCHKGFSQDEIFQRSAIYGVNWLPPEHQLFYIYLKTRRTLSYWEKQLERDSEFSRRYQGHVFVVEESHRIVSNILARRNDQLEPYLWRANRQSRKRKGYFLYTEQNLGTIPTPILSNVGCLLIGKILDHRSLQILRQVTGWDEDQVDHIRNLPPRHFVIRLPSCPDGIEFKTPDIEPPRTSKDEIQERMDEILSNIPWLPEANRISPNIRSGVTDVSNSDIGDSVEQLRDVHTRALKSVLQNPHFSTSEHAESIGMTSPWTMNHTVEELKNMGLLEIFAFSVGQRGSPPRFLKLTETGAQFIGADPRKARITGKGGFEHAILQHRIRQYLQAQGCSATVEFNLNGKSVDLAQFEADGNIRVFEVELHATGHVVENINRDLDAGCREVVIVTRNKTEQKRIMALVNAELVSDRRDKVEFRTIEQIRKKGAV